MSSIPSSVPVCITGNSLPLQTAHSRRELAEIFGIAEWSVSRWMKRDDWRFGHGPWNAATIAQIRQWRRKLIVDGHVRESSFSLSPWRSKATIGVTSPNWPILFIRVADCIFPIHTRTPNGSEILPDGRYIIEVQRAAKLAGVSVAAMRSYWIHNVAASEITGLEVVK